MSLSLSVRRAIRERGLIDATDCVAVCVSGGADSVALAFLIAEIAGDGPWSCRGLIHVNHGLRGAESDEDERFVRALAGRLSLPLSVQRVDVSAARRDRPQSIEAAARAVRYQAFDAGARELNATRVLTGHTADDQAETVLLRLLRGTSLRGVSAIRARRGHVSRPLLAVRRADVRAWLAERGESFREDSSNLDIGLTRNRLRRTLLPVIERDWPGAVAALARFAAVAADDESYLTREAQSVLTRAVESTAGGVQLDVEVLAALDPAVTRRVVRLALEATGGTASWQDVDALDRLLRSAEPGRIDVRTVRAGRSGTRLSLVRRGATPTTEFEYELPVPGCVRVRETGAEVRASLSSAAPIEARAAGPARQMIQANRVTFPLTVRSRRPGDRFRPFGAPGSRKLQDLLVDRKIPREERSAVPIVTDATGRIVWVAGVAVADECRVTSPESGVVILDFDLKKGEE